MRKLLIGLAALVVIVVSAALVVPSFIDWNGYKPEIAAQAKLATGRDLKIDGDLQFEILPAPRLSAAGVRFANVEGGSDPVMASLKSLDVSVRLKPLLGGKIEIDSVRLVEPVILLEKLKNGRANWEMAGASGAPAATGDGAGAASSGGPGGNDIRLDSLQIENGTFIWRDAASGSEERLSGVTLALSAGSLQGPFDAKGTVVYRRVPTSVEASLGQLRPGAAAPLRLVLGDAASGATAALTGTVVALGAPPRFSGKIDISGKTLLGAISSFADAPPMTALSHPFRLRARIRASEETATIDQIDAELGGTRASGTVKAALSGRPKIETTLRITRVDLDELLKGVERQENVPSSRSSTTGDAAPPKEAKQASPFALPDIDATLDLGLDAIIYNGRTMRDIAVTAALADGKTQLTRATVFLPGGGEASMTGSLAARDGKPAYTAGISARADNFRSLLGWLGLEVEAVPKERLHRFSFSGEVTGNDNQLQLLNGKIELDTTRVDGAMTLALRDRPAFGATVSVDKVDLDAYLPADGKTSKASTGATQAGKPDAVSGKSAAQSNAGGPLAALNLFDANLRLRVGQLTYRKQPIHGVEFDGTVAGGKLTIRNAAVRDLAGVRASVAGALSERAGLPVFKGSVSADARNIAGALRLAGIAPPDAVRSLGALKVRGKADAGADRADLDLTINAAGATVALKAVAGGFDKAPSYDVTLSAKHRELKQLLAAFGVDIRAPRLGAFDLSATAKGGLTALKADVRIKAAGGILAAQGTGSALVTKPVFDFTVAAAHPAVGTLMKSFAPDYRPRGGAIGPLKLQAALKGSDGVYALRDLKLDAGKLSLIGAGDLKTGGARPALVASLKAGAIDMNPFLPVRAGSSEEGRRASGTASRGGSAGSAGNRQAGRFSDDKFDTTVLGLMDADLSIAAATLLYRQFQVDNPTIRTRIKDRQLAITDLSGRMFDGAFRLTGDLDGRTTPRLKGRVTVSKANVGKAGKAILQGSDFDLSGGITDFSLDVAAAGSSPRRMIAGLNGAGRLSSLNGVIKGFDLKAVNERLKNLNGALDFISLLTTAMSGGATRFQSLNGTFGIKNGVLRTSDMKLLADAGEGRVTGFADLPRWNMDFRGAFNLTDHPKAPPFEMQAIGPIDDPARKFNHQKLQSYLLQRGIGSIVDRVLPGVLGGSSRQNAPQNQQNTQQQKQQRTPRLEDVIQSLPGLFRR